MYFWFIQFRGIKIRLNPDSLLKAHAWLSRGNSDYFEFFSVVFLSAKITVFHIFKHLTKLENPQSAKRLIAWATWNVTLPYNWPSTLSQEIL